MIVRSFLLVAFLEAGTFKGDPVLQVIPVDLTVLFGGLCVVLSAWDVLRRGVPSRRSVGWMCVVFVPFLVPLLWTDFTPESYSLAKAFGLILTAVAAGTPLAMIRTQRSLRIFFVALFSVALVLTAEAALMLLSTGLPSGQLSLHTSSTITLARAISQGCLWLTAVLLFGQNTGWVRLAAIQGAIVMMTIVCYCTGSRGPWFTFVLVATCMGLSSRIAHRMVIRISLVFSLVLLGAVVAPLIAPSQSRTRIEGYWTGSDRVSGRGDLYHSGAQVVFSYPFGLGWGGAQVWNPLANGDRYYFHNVFLEVAVEAGWLAAIALGAALLVAFESIFRVARRTRSAESVCLCSLLFFCCVQAQISGDINDNRWLFALMSLAIAFGRKGEQYPAASQADYRILHAGNNLKSAARQLIARANARDSFGPTEESIAYKSDSNGETS